MRTLLALAFTLTVASSAMAQTLTQLATLNLGFRQGTVTTASYDLPANLTDLADEILIEIDMPTSSYEDAALRMGVYVNRLVGGFWQQFELCQIIGGRYIDPELGTNPPKQCSADPSKFAGYTVRGEIQTNINTRYSVTVYAVKR